MKRLLFALVLLIAAPAAAQNADDALEAALNPWRAASWYARIGDASVAALELEDFREKWAALAQDTAPPASHARDPHWRDIAAEIGRMADAAAAALERGELPIARTALAAIGNLLATSRGRSGSTGYPEAMRRYRDATEALIGFMAASERYGMGPMDRALHDRIRVAAREAAAAVNAMVPLAPARWADEAKFRELLQQNVEGARNLAAVMDRAQPPALGLEANGLIGVARANYNLLFIGYGY